MDDTLNLQEPVSPTAIVDRRNNINFIRDSNKDADKNNNNNDNRSTLSSPSTVSTPSLQQDYFSINRQSSSLYSQGNYIKSPLSSPRDLSLGSNLSNSPAALTNSKFNYNNRPSNLKFFLSPLITTPTMDDSSTALSSSSLSSNISASFIRDPSHPSVLYELEEKAHNLSKDFTSFNFVPFLPHDYLNVSLKDGKNHTSKSTAKIDCFSTFSKDYKLLNKIYDDDHNNVISCYLAENKSTKQKFVIRFIFQLTVGSISRLVNSYYVNSDIDTREPRSGFAHIIDSIGWHYKPRTLPSSISGVLPCTHIDFYDNNQTLVAFYPIHNNTIPLNKINLNFNDILTANKSYNEIDIFKLIKIFINLLKVLQNIHTYGIVNNSLTLSNIFINPDTLDIFLMGFDFSFSSSVELQEVAFRSANKSESLKYLPFTAPENFKSACPVDFRADIYGAGSIIYSLIYNKFQKSSNLLNLIVTKSTSKYTPLHDININIPIELSKIISKMTEIDANSRYSSIDYIIYDLVKVYNKYINISKEKLPIYKIDSNIKRIPVLVPYKIVGRDKVVKKITEMIYSRSVQCMTLSGKIGIGKSCILNSIKIPSQSKKIFFTTWKCHNSNFIESKFQTFDCILSQILREILVMDKSDILFWRNLLSVEIKADLSILFESVPEIKSLLGLRYKHIKRSENGQMFYQNELNHQYVLKKIFELLSKNAGWVLVIENIDELSEVEASMLEELWIYLKGNFQDDELNFNLLTSYTEKDNKLLDQYENIPFFLKNNVIRIEPLLYEDVQEMTNLSLHLYDSQFLWKKINSKEYDYYYELKIKTPISNERRELINWVYRFSRGNPLIVKEMLIKIHFAQLESSDPLSPFTAYKKYLKSVEHAFLCGDFSLKSIYDNISPENDEATTIFKYAACLYDGNSFNLYDLSVVTGIDISKLHRVLFTGTIISVLLSCSISCKLPFGSMDTDLKSPLRKLSTIELNYLLKFTKFKFMHESVHKNLTELMKNSNELKKYHKTCGLKLYHQLEKINIKMDRTDCFSIAYHFVNSWEIAKPEEYSIYCNILITAGWCAYSSYEHVSALNYFQTAKKLTNDNLILKGLNWVEIHIYTLKGKHEKCIELSELAIKKYIKNKEDVAQFMIFKLRSLRALNKWEEAFAVCLEVFEVLDFHLNLKSMSDTDIKNYVNKELKPKLPSSPSEIHELKKIPILKNRKILLTQLALGEMNQFSVYLSKPALLPFSNLMNFVLFMEYGKSMYCSLSLIVIASFVVSTGGAQSIKQAHEYCKLAFNMVSGNNMEENELFMISFRWYCALVGSLMEPLDRINQSFDLSILNSKVQVLESTFTKGIILKFKFHMWLSQGLTLPRLYERMEIIADTYRPKEDPGLLFDESYKIVTGVLDVMTGDLSFEDYSNRISELQKCSSNQHIKLIYNTNRCASLYILRKYELGADIGINELYPGSSQILASIELPWARYILILILYKDRIRRIKNNCLQDEETVKFIDKILKDTVEFFKELSEQNPTVFLCMYLTMDALIKVLNDTYYSQIDILAAFEDAVRACGEYHNYFFEAIAAEECGRWLKRVAKDDKFSIKYFKIAFNSYKTWGLTLKVKQLNEEFGNLIDSSLDFKTPFSRSKRTSKYFFQNDALPFQSYPSSSIDSENLLNLKRSFDKNNTGNPIAGFSLIKSRSDDAWDETKSTTSSRISSSNNVNTDILPKLQSDSVSTTNSIISERRSSNVPLDSSSVEYSNFTDVRTQDDDWDNELVMNLSIKIVQLNDVEEILKTLIIFAIHFVQAEFGCIVLNSEDDVPFIKAICLKNDEVRFLQGEILSLRGDLVPISVIEDCMNQNSSIWRESDKFYFDTTYRDKESYFESNDCENVICIPIRTGESEVVGTLYLENQRKSTFIKTKKIDLLEYLCLQSFISIAKTEMFVKLEIAKKAAENATADRTNFLANMSHEIRTPFNSLMSCAIFLLDTNLTKTQKMYVETIKNSALVTLNIIDGILSFSKLEHGSLTLSYEPFNLSLCVEDAIQLVAEQATSKNLELVFINNSYPIEKIFGDKTRITQIIINLLGNATKFTNSGYIIIETTCAEITKDRFEFKIIVKDSGIGIPEGSKSRVFKIFNQLDGSSKREYGGSGLGLAISKKLAEYMGGDLDYISEEGKGTEFCFTFSSKGIPDENFVFENTDSKIVIIDNRKLSVESLENCLKKRNFDNVSIFNELDFEKLVKFGDVDFIFIYYKLVENEADIKKLKQICSNSYVVSEVPFGVKIPDYAEDDTSDVDFILLNPFRRPKLYEILSNKKINDVNNKGNTGKGKIKSSDNTKDKKTEPKLGEKYPLSILVAEDNAINTKVVRLQLKRLGYESDHAKDGVEVIEKSLEKFDSDGKPYDLILMDLQMPRKDGFEATIEIKEKYGEVTRIVALSANVYAEEKNKCREIGMSGFLNKPLLPEALAAELVEAYDAHSDATAV